MLLVVKPGLVLIANKVLESIMVFILIFYDLGLVAHPILKQCLLLPSAWQFARVAMSFIGMTVVFPSESQY